MLDRTEHIGIAGSGAIACGIAAVAAVHHDEVVLLARSQESAERARSSIDKLFKRLSKNGGEPEGVSVATEHAAIADATFVIEAIAEELDAKSRLLSELGAVLGADSILATTTSSLSIAALAAASGRPERFVGLHVFNPVTRMELVELVYPADASEDTHRRARAVCKALGKTAVEVPDVPGFVVNQLLFPFLFEAVRLLERSTVDAEAIDSCMRLGAHHPLGPLAVLDLVGLDVAASIGEAIGEPVPERLRELIAAGALGRKAGRGFHSYE